MAGDHYAALGVSRTATAPQIKVAYRRLAKECHPDRHQGDPNAETRFREITNAYDVLSDPQKRAEYDKTNKGFSFSFDRPPTTPGRRTSTAQGKDYSNVFGAFNVNLPEMQLDCNQIADEIAKEADGFFHEGDSVLIDGVQFSFHRVLFNKPNDSRKYRSARPVLCREMAVLAPVVLVPGQRLTEASLKECQHFKRRSDIVAREFRGLWQARAGAAQIAEEVESLLEENDEVSAGGQRYVLKSCAFIRKGKAFRQVVLCADAMVLSKVDGEPGDPATTFASREVANAFSRSYRKVCSEAIAKAKGRGKTVPPHIGINPRNWIGSQLARWG